jgi:hypothetical protein
MTNFKSHLFASAAAFMLLAFGSACGDTSSATPPPAGTTAPTILSKAPASGAVDVALNGSVSATFSEAMDPGTMNGATFTLTSGTMMTPVAGTVVYANNRLVFWPAAHFDSNGSYTATISTGAKSAGGMAMAMMSTWSFGTGTVVAAGLPVNLGTAGGFVILAKTGVSTVPASVITGDVGVSPAAATYLTGFSQIAGPSNVFSTSPQVTGKLYAADYAVPTPSNLTTAIGDMGTAFTDAAGRAPGVTELGAGNVGGQNLTPGVYKWGTGLLIPSDVTFTGSATDVWILQIAQDLTISNGVRVNLAGGALAKNIFWQVAGMASLGTTAHLEGVVLSQTSITLGTGATVNGRLLAQTAVSLDTATVVQPAP